MYVCEIWIFTNNNLPIIHDCDDIILLLLVLQIRTFGMTVSGLFNASSGFFVAKTFPILLNAIDLYGCMFIYGCGCIIGAIFVFIATKEMSGQRIDDVDDYIRADSKIEQSSKSTDQQCSLILQQKSEHNVI